MSAARSIPVPAACGDSSKAHRRYAALAVRLVACAVEAVATVRPPACPWAHRYSVWFATTSCDLVHATSRSSAAAGSCASPSATRRSDPYFAAHGPQALTRR